MSRMNKNLVLGGLLALVGCSAGAEPETIGSTEEQLSPYWVNVDWSMPKVFGLDRDRDGLIDLTPPKEAFRPQSYTVTIDACATRPPRSSVSQYVWELTGFAAQTTTQCQVVYTLPASTPSFNLKLTVRLADGSAGVKELTIRPKNYIIVSMGDSIASGEGNPDVAAPGVRWVDARCHRSANSGPARAALQLENADPHSSVTFLSVACSGAGITRGILGDYAGQQPDGSFFNLEPQLTQVNRALCSVQRTCAPSEMPPIDALLLTVGANDVDFGELVRRCAYPKEDCVGNVRDGVSRAFAALPAVYDRLGQSLTTNLNIKNTFITEYPDPTHDDSGNYCNDTFIGAVDDNYSTGTRTALGAVVGYIFGGPAASAIAAVTLARIHDGNISTSENRYAFESVVTPLDQAVQAAAIRNRWKYVGNITSQFATHGYCANNHYMIRYDESKARQSNVDGTMHPNASGQQIYANQLSAAVRATFSSDPLPPDGGSAGRSAWGFSWSQGGSGTFTASDGYARNSLVTTGSSGNNITRFDVGFYRADFPKLGSYAGGNVQVTAYGWDNTRCKVAGFGPNGDTMQAYVLCFDPSGNLVDSAFTASFTSNFETASTQIGYLWADQPSATDYTVSGAYQYNSTGNTNSIHRWGVGQYTATLPGMSNNSFGGTAEVTAGGWGSEHCKVSSWGGETVNINCYDTYGNLADSVFSVRFGAAETLNAPSYAYAWANEPSSALYTPATYYQRIQLTSSCHSPSGPVTIQRGGLGSYYVNVPSLNPAGSTVKVTAYGWTSDTCKVNGWWSNGVDGTQISVSCFDAQGQPVDSYFVVNYSTDQYEIC